MVCVCIYVYVFMYVCIYIVFAFKHIFIICLTFYMYLEFVQRFLSISMKTGLDKNKIIIIILFFSEQ